MRSPFMNTLELSEYLRFIVRSGPRKGTLDTASARKWCQRHGVPFTARGRMLLVLKADVDAKLEQRRMA